MIIVPRQAEWNGTVVPVDLSSGNGCPDSRFTLGSNGDVTIGSKEAC